MPGENDILNNREKINEIDKQVLDLLNQRAEISLNIRELKKTAGIDVYDPAREEEVVDALCEQNGGPIDDENVRKLFLEIMEIMRGLPDKN